MTSNPSKLEMFPNELLLGIFGYFEFRDLYDSFSNLNFRFNQLLRSMKNFSIILEYNNPLVVSLFSRRIIRLIVVEWTDIDLKRFPNLRSLTLIQATDAQMRQIQYEVTPNLEYLSISSKFNSLPLIQLINKIFSNEFPLLRHIHFHRFVELHNCSWSFSPTIKSISIIHCEIAMIAHLLASCPRLSYLQIELSYDHQHINFPAISFANHPLKQFILIDSYGTSISNHMNTLLFCMPNVERLYLQFDCKIPLVHLMSTIASGLTHLRQFHCEITVPSMIDLDIVRQIHPCFNRIKEEGKFAIVS